MVTAMSPSAIFIVGGDDVAAPLSDSNIFDQIPIALRAAPYHEVPPTTDETLISRVGPTRIPRIVLD